MGDLREILLKKFDNFFKEREALIKVELEESKMLDKHILYISFAALAFLLKFVSDHNSTFDYFQKVLITLVCMLFFISIFIALQNLLRNKGILEYKEKLLNLEIDITYKILLTSFYKEKNNNEELFRTAQNIKKLEKEKLSLKEDLDELLYNVALEQKEGMMLAFLFLGVILTILIVIFLT